MANPSTRWDFVPVFGVYLRLDDTPSAGRVTFTMPSRVTRVDGRVIYPEGASVTVTIGDTAQQDSAIRSAVRAAWRAADQAAQGAGFDGVAWDTWWDDIVVPAAIFTSFPASDDPDIVQQGWSVSVSEGLTSGKGKSYAIQPLLAQLDQPIPGINLGTIEVPPGSATVPAPMYAKGIAGGVAALDADGDVTDATGAKIVGGSGSGDATTAASITDATTVGRAVLTAASAAAARTAIGAGTSSLGIGTTAGTAADAVAVTTALAGKADSSHAHTTAQVTGLDTALAGKAAASHTHTVSQVTDLTLAGLGTLGYVKAVLIANGGTPPAGLPAGTLVIELAAG